MSTDSLLDEVNILVNDVQYSVNHIRLSGVLPQSPHIVYLNVETKENRKFTIQLTLQGFKVVSEGQFDKDDGTDSAQFPTAFETIYALLENISPSFVGMFGNALKDKLEALQSAQDNENESS